MALRANATRLGILLLAAVCPTLQPNAQPISEVEVTADGLHRIDPAVMPAAWLNPEADFAQYTRAFVLPTFILYRKLSKPSHSAWADSTRTAFPLSEHMKKRLQQSFGESFHEIMESQRIFETVEELGRDVVMVRGYLSDVATGMPLDLAGANVNTIRWAWEANLVVELVDSMSDTVLFRAIDRQRVDGPLDADILYAIAPRVTSQWSRTMVDRMQELANFYPSRLYRMQERARNADGSD